MTTNAFSGGAIAALLLVAGQAGADVTLHYSNPLAQGGELTLAASGDRAAMRFPLGQGEGRILYESDGNRMFVVIDRDRTYLDMDDTLATLGGLAGLLAGMMEDMPDDLKSQVEGLLDNAGSGKVRSPAVSDTGLTDHVLGNACRIATYRWQDAETEVCLAPPGELGIDAGEFAVLRAMVAKQVASLKQLGEILGFTVPDLGLDLIDRVPLRVRQLSGPDAGAGMEFLGIRYGVDGALMSVPSDYRRISLAGN